MKMDGNVMKMRELEKGLEIPAGATVTLKPANLLGLKCGRIEKGAPADLILVDLNAPRLIDADKLLSKSKNSAFDGRRLQGEVKMTFVDGRVVFGG